MRRTFGKFLVGVYLTTVAFSCIAQEKKILPLLVDTNGGVLLTNATFSSVIGKRITFRTESGVPRAFDVAQISETNLAALKVDTKKASAEQQRINEARKAAMQPIPAGEPGEVKQVTIQKITGSIGYDKCVANIKDEGSKEVLIHLPSPVKNYLVSLDKAKAERDRLKESHRIAQKNYNEARANQKTFVGDLDFIIAKQNEQANRLSALDSKVDEARDALSESERKLLAIEREKNDSTVLTARFSGKRYGATEIWEPASLSTLTSK